MSRKSKRILLSIGGALLSSAVIAAAVPKNVVVFFLPVSDLTHTDSLHESKTTPTRSGTLTSAVTNTLPSDSALKPKPHGMDAAVGVSLYDKPAKWTNDQAANAVLSPAKVMILPPETLKTKRKSKLFSKPAGEVNPVQVRIYPLKNPVKAVKAEAKARPIAVKTSRPVLPPAVKNSLPENRQKWYDWVVSQLGKCDADINAVLDVAALIMKEELKESPGSCTIRTAVADYLRKCHPWPTVYYSPFNNDVPKNKAVQKSVDFLEAAADDDYLKACPVLDLSHVNFEKIEFIRGFMAGHNFSGSYFKEAYFLSSDFSETVFQDAVLENVLFKDVELTKSFFKNAKMRFSHLHETYATMVNFDNADLSNTQFRDVPVSFSSFKNANIENTAWQDVLAYRVDMDGVSARQAVFDNIVLDESTARKSDFAQLNCRNCYMDKVVFPWANFSNAVFKDVNLMSADVSHARFNQAVFKGNIFFSKAVTAYADFSGADIKAVSDMPLDNARHVVVDRETLPPDTFPDFDSADYDERLYRRKAENPFVCSRDKCEDVKLGKSSGHNLAMRAMTILAYPPKNTNDALWAICTLGCLANDDKKLENAAIDILAGYVKEKRAWSAQDNLFKPIEPMTADVDFALKTLTNPDFKRDLGHQIDLSHTDLRLADFENADLRNVNFAGSYLGGVNMKNAKTDAEYDNFDQAVIDEFTRLPDNMASFQPYALPESEYPDWWKPESVRVLVHGSHPWNQIVEKVPFSDEYIAKYKRNGK